jgi:PAS domain S-box-containing protein
MAWLRGTARVAAASAIFGCSYFAAAVLGSWLSITPGKFVAFWPPAGLYWAILITVPARYWPAFMLAALPASLTTDILLQKTSLYTAVGYFGVDTLGAIAAASVLRRWASVPFTLDGVRSVVILAGLSLIIPFALSGPGAALFLLIQSEAAFAGTWVRWALSDWSGIWLTAPLVLTLLSRQSRYFHARPASRPVEATLLLALLIVVSYLTYFDRLGLVSTASLPALLLLWSAVRFGMGGVSVAIFIVAVLATRAAESGEGPFVNPELPHELVELKVGIYLGVISTVFHVIAAILEERAKAQHELRRLNNMLESLANDRAEALCQVGRRYEALIAQSFGGIAEVDPDGRFLCVNDRFCELTGYGREELVRRMRMQDITCTDDLLNTSDHFQHLLAGGAPYVIEKRYIRKDGQPIWVNNFVSAVRDSAGRLTSVAAIVVDITDRKHAEQALNLSEERLRLALSAARLGTWDWDLASDRVYLDTRCSEILGLAEISVLTSDGFYHLIHPDDRDTVRAAHDAALNPAGNRQVDVRYRLHLNGGTPRDRWIRAIGLAQCITPGGAARVTGVLQDITESVQAQQALAEHQNLMEQLVRERTAELQAIADKLALSEQRNRVLMENTQTAIFLADSDGKYLYANPSALSALGYTQEELLTLHIPAIVATDDRARLEQALEAARQGSHGVDTWHLKPKSGHPIPFELSLQQLPDSRFVAIGFDKTERLAAEKQHQLAASVFNNTFEGILITDADGTIVDVNQSFVELTGYSREEAIGQNPRLLNSGRHDHAFFKTMRSAYLQQGYWQGEIWNRCKDGHIATHLMTISAVRDADRNISHFIGLFTDITERKLAEMKIRESEELLRLATESANIGLWTWEIGSDKTFWTETFRALHGLPLDSPPSYESFLKAVHPEDRERVDDDILRVIRERSDLDQEYRVLWPGGSLHWLASIGSGHCDDRGQVTRITGVCMDVSERKAAEQLLKTQREALESNDRQKDEFIAMLSHEIRNPLAAINNAIAVLHRTGSSDSNILWVENTIGGQLKQLNRLVGDLLDVSRITHGKFELKVTRIAVSDLIKRALEMSQPFIDKLGHRLFVSTTNEDLYLDADMTRLVQVIDNLLHNAAKYTPSHGQIALSVERERSHLVIRIRDNGVGIAPEMLPHVFTLFAQGPANPHHLPSGMGIGLSLVERLVKLHNGTIEVASAGINQGSEFTVRLPLADQRHHTRPESVREAEAPGETRQLRILVVDDEPAVAESFAMLLSVMGHVVEVAYNGGDAFRKIAPFKPEVVFLDIGLPGMSGYEILRGLQVMPVMLDVPVIALTGYGQEQDIKRSAEAGFFDHLIKPVDPQKLESVLESLFNRFAAPGARNQGR